MYTTNTRRPVTQQIVRRTYTIDEAAALLGIGRNSAYEAARRGDIPTILVGKRKLVPRARFDKLLDGDDRLLGAGP
jgi:excisionase family DNA binding protein